MFCTQCGHENRDDARFCEECGSPFDAVDAGQPRENEAAEDSEAQDGTQVAPDPEPELEPEPEPEPESELELEPEPEPEAEPAPDSAMPSLAPESEPTFTAESEPAPSPLAALSKRPHTVIAAASLVVVVLALASLAMWWRGRGVAPGVWTQVSSYTRHYHHVDADTPVAQLESLLPEYDSGGQLVAYRRSLVSSSSSAAWETSERVCERDRSGRPIVIIQEGPTYEVAEDKKTSALVRISYDGRGNESSRCLSETISGWGHELADFDEVPIMREERSEYDDAGRLLSSSVAPMAYDEATPDAITTQSYSYDEAGRLLSVSEMAGDEETSHLDFTYDDDAGTMRWEQAIDGAYPPSGQSQLDGSGNEFIRFGAYSLEDDLAKGTTAVCSVHDAEGRVISEEGWASPDENGDCQLIWMRKYEYDELGNLIVESYSSRGDTVVTTYGYKDYATGEDRAAPNPDEVRDIVFDEENCTGPVREEWHEDDAAALAELARDFEAPEAAEQPALTIDPAILLEDQGASAGGLITARRQTQVLDSYASMLAELYSDCDSSISGHPAKRYDNAGEWAYQYYYAFATGDLDGDDIPELVLFHNEETTGPQEWCGARLFKLNETTGEIDLIAEPGFIGIVNGVTFYKMATEAGGSIKLSYAEEGWEDQFIVEYPWHTGIDARVVQEYNLVSVRDGDQGPRLWISDMFSTDMGPRALSADEAAYLMDELTGGGERQSQYMPFTAESIASLSKMGSAALSTRMSDATKLQMENSFESHPEHRKSNEGSVGESIEESEQNSEKGFPVVGAWGAFTHLDGFEGDFTCRFETTSDGRLYFAYSDFGQVNRGGGEAGGTWTVESDGTVTVNLDATSSDGMAAPTEMRLEQVGERFYLTITAPPELAGYSTRLFYFGDIPGG